MPSSFVNVHKGFESSSDEIENLIGKGGYAEVYRGTLPHGELIAVKRLIKGTAEERTADFLSELGIIAHINHKNAARLVGFSVEGGMHLVLQLSPHGSLASLLYGMLLSSYAISVSFDIVL